MSLATMLSKRMQVVNADVTRQVGGAVDYKWDESGASYPCDLQPLSTNKQINFNALGIDATHTLFWNPSDVTISESSRVIIDNVAFKLSTNKVPSVQRPNWPAQAIVVEARL